MIALRLAPAVRFMIDNVPFDFYPHQHLLVSVVMDALTHTPSVYLLVENMEDDCYQWVCLSDGTVVSEHLGYETPEQAVSLLKDTIGDEDTLAVFALDKARKYTDFKHLMEVLIPRL